MKTRDKWKGVTTYRVVKHFFVRQQRKSDLPTMLLVLFGMVSFKDFGIVLFLESYY